MKYTNLNPDKLNPEGWRYESDNREHYLVAPLHGKLGDNAFDSDGRYIPAIVGFESKSQAKAFLAAWREHRARGGK